MNNDVSFVIHHFIFIFPGCTTNQLYEQLQIGLLQLYASSFGQSTAPV